MAIDVEVSGATVSSSSHGVGKFAECREIVSGVKCDAIFERQSFTRDDACCGAALSMSPERVFGERPRRSRVTWDGWLRDQPIRRKTR